MGFRCGCIGGMGDHRGSGQCSIGPDITARTVRRQGRYGGVYLVISNEGRTPARGIQVVYHNVEGQELPVEIEQLSNGQTIYRPLNVHRSDEGPMAVEIVSYYRGSSRWWNKRRGRSFPVDGWFPI